MRGWFLNRFRAAAALLVALTLTGAGVATAHGGLLWPLIDGQQARGPTPRGPIDRVPPEKRLVEPSYQELRPEDAAQRAGFRIRLPSVLPEGVDPSDVSVTVSHVARTDIPLVGVTYWSVQMRERGYSRRAVVILKQLPVQAEPWFRPEKWITPTGEPLGATCQQEGASLRPGIDAIRFTCTYGAPFLTWVDDGLEFQLTEAGLTPEETLYIARSVR